jgi:hypothetical protein
MFEILRVRQVTINELKSDDKDYYFMPRNITMQHSMNIIVNRKGVRLDLSNQQIDEMILYGFTSMAEYIDRRKELLYAKNKERLSGLDRLDRLAGTSEQSEPLCDT